MKEKHIKYTKTFRNRIYYPGAIKDTKEEVISLANSLRENNGFRVKVVRLVRWQIYWSPGQKGKIIA